MDENWEEEFKTIVSGLDMDDIEAVPEQLTLWELHRAVLGMNEVSMYLGACSLDLEKDEELDLPEDVVLFVREIITLTGALSDILSECECDACQQMLDLDDDDDE